jgi:hypothetical protein
MPLAFRSGLWEASSLLHLELSLTFSNGGNGEPFYLAPSALARLRNLRTTRLKGFYNGDELARRFKHVAVV